MEGLELKWLGETLWLLSDKAIYRPRRHTLLVADTHFGKAATFRHAGVPIPHGTTAADLARLDALLSETGASKLVILGDFWHASTGRAERTLNAIGTWRQAHRQLGMTLVRGNHDRGAGDPPSDWQIECVEEQFDAPLVFMHDAQPDERGYALGGHIHPSVTLRDRTGPPLKAACFWFSTNTAVLPAFGSFTGTATIQPTGSDRVFVVGPGAVREVPMALSRPRRR